MNKTMKEIIAKNQLSIKQLLLTDWAEQFNESQLRQIYYGLEDKLDVSIYAKTKFTWEQMEEIRLELFDKAGFLYLTEIKRIN